MLTFFGERNRLCDSVSRRSFLQVGAAGVGGLTLADLLRLESQAATGGSKESVINIFLSGGPTHHDTFDLQERASRDRIAQPISFAEESQHRETPLESVGV